MRLLSLPTCAIVLLAALLVTSSPAAEESWPGFRGPNGDGRSEEALPEGAAPLALELAWTRPLGSAYSGISVADGLLVTALTNGERDVVVALAADSGEEHWRADLGPAHAGHDGAHDGPISTPAIADGRVFMLGPWGDLAAFDLDTGAELWRRHLVDDLGSEKPFYCFGSSPLVVGDTMVVQIGGEEGSVAGFDVRTGETRWRTLPGEVMSQSPIAAMIDGEPQALVLGFDKVAGIDPKSGDILWQLDLEGRPDDMGAMTQSPLLLDDGAVFLKHTRGKTTFINLPADDGGKAPAITHTSRGLARSYSPPTRAGDVVYGYSGRFLSAVESATGELLWRSREPGDGFLIGVEDQLAVLTKNGSLHLGAAARDGWRETTRIDLFDDLAWTPPTYADGAFYVRSLGEIARVDVTRDAASLASVAGTEIPPVLRALAAEIDSGVDPSIAVDRFLDGRELPLIDGETVVFLWRGGEDVAIAGDMIGMRREERMHRLGATDLWWWTTEIDRRARISYVFFSDYNPATDPSHQRVVTSTVLGPDMNWQRDEPLEMSWFAMPDWPGRLPRVAEPTAETRGNLEKLTVTVQPPTPEEGEMPEAIAVPVRVWLPPDYGDEDRRYPTVYVHHPAALGVGRWEETLNRVVGRSVEPLIAVFPELPWRPGIGQLFVEQLVPEIDRRFRTRPEREARANIAMAWKGFGMAALTFRNSDVFGALGIQSMYLLDEHMQIVESAIGEATAATVPMKIYLEWGKWDLVSPHEEMDFRASSKWAWDLFSSRGWQPIGGEMWDSTDMASWRNRTGVLLEALYPLGDGSGELSRWQTGAP